MNIRTFAWLLIGIALLMRLALVVSAGNASQTSLSGGSDTIVYQLLGDNLAHHRGLSYAGMPTALRPPLYPVLLGAAQRIAGRDYRITVRLLQFLAGIATASLCARACGRLGGVPLIAFAAALAAPTLVFLSGELLTETFAALIVAAFLWGMVEDASPLLMGALIGAGMLERFNLVVLPVTYVAYQCAVRKPAAALKATGLAAMVALLVVSPWFVRNLTVFHGAVLYSTQTGTNLLQGVITPEGRTQPGRTPKLESSSGYVIEDIETNSPKRLRYPAEPALDKKAEVAAISEYFRTNLFLLVARKLGSFWLGLDQLLYTNGFSVRARLVRGLGVIGYWALLAFAIYGWTKVRARKRSIALAFPIYAIVVTILHLPFVMNTRIRSPLIEPALCILAGIAFSGYRSIRPETRRDIGESEEPLTCNPGL